MMDLDISFEESPWQQMLDRLGRGDTLSALSFLPLVSDLEEDDVQEALDALLEKGVSLSLEGLPESFGSGTQTPRLQLEHKLSREGKLMEGLQEGDPLGVYLEEVQNAQKLPDAQNPLEAMLPQVILMAQEFTGRGVLLMDLIQEGSLGLCQGLAACQKEEDIKEHCCWWARQYMMRAVLLQARSGELGQKLRQGMEDYRDMDQALLSQLGRSPTREEIADRIHVSPEDAEIYEKMIQLAQTRQMVDKAMAGPGKPEEEEEQAVEDTAYFRQRQRITELLSVLPEEDAKLLSLRFGLEGGLPMSPEQTGEMLGLTPQEVVDREAKALMTMRQQG